MRPGKRKALDKDNQADAMIDQAEKLKAGVRAKEEHPFRVIKRQFGFIKVRYCGLKKNTAQLFTLFVLSNLWIVRSKLMGAQGMSAPENRARALQRAKKAQEGSKNNGISGTFP